MPGVLEATGHALRILYDMSVPATPHRCSETVGSVLGFSVGNANQSPGYLKQHGYSVRQGAPQPGDVFVIDRFGNDPRTPGYQYGHNGIVVRLNGKLMYASNFNGRRMVRPLEQNGVAYAPPRPFPVVRKEYDGPVGRGSTSWRVPLQVSGSNTGLSFNEPASTLQFNEPATASYQQYLAQLPSSMTQDLAGQSAPSPLEPLRGLVEAVVNPGGAPEAAPLQTLAQSFLEPDRTPAEIPQALEAGAQVAARPVGAVADFAQGLSNLSAQLLVRAMADDAERAQKPWLNESVGQMISGALFPKDAYDRFGWVELLQGINERDMQRRQMMGETLTASTVNLNRFTAFALGMAADVLSNPLSYIGLGTESVSRAGLNRAAMQSAVKLGEELLPDVQPQRLKSLVDEWLYGKTVTTRRTGEAAANARKYGGAVPKDLWADLEAGGSVAGKWSDNLASFLRRKTGASEEAATAFAGRMTDDLRRAKLAPFNILGYPLPKSAKVRDRVRIAVGLPGIDFRLSHDPLHLEMRERLAQQWRTLTGVEPLTAFESQEEAQYWRSLQKYAKAAEEVRVRRAPDVRPEMYAGAAADANARQAARAQDMMEQEGLSSELWPITGEKMATAEIEGEARQVGHEELRGSTKRNKLAAAWEYVHPDGAMARQWREALRVYPTGSRNISTTLHGQVETLMHGVSDLEARGLYRWSDVTGNPNFGAGVANRLTDLLATTGELSMYLPSGTVRDTSSVTMDVARELMRGDGVNMPLLREKAPRAARLIDLYNEKIRPWFDGLYKEELPYVHNLNSNSIETRMPSHRKDYIPNRVARLMDAAVDDLKAGRVATTPQAQQSFQHVSRYRHGGQMFQDMIQEHTDKVTGIVDYDKLPVVMTDLRQLMHIRAQEHVRLRQFHEAQAMVRKYGIPVSDPAAADLVRYADYTPLPRIHAAPMNAAEKSRIAQKYGDVAERLQLHYRAIEENEDRLRTARDNLARARHNARTAVRDTHTIGEDPVLTNLHEQLGRMENTLPLPIAKWSDIPGQAAAERSESALLNGKTWWEMWRGRTKSLSREEVARLMKEAGGYGTIDGYLGMGSKLTKRSMMEFYFTLNDDMPEGIRERMLRALKSRYGMAGSKPSDVRRWERVKEYVEQFGPSHAADMTSTTSAGELNEMYRQIKADAETAWAPYANKVMEYMQAERAHVELQDHISDLHDQRRALLKSLKWDQDKLAKAPGSERPAIQERINVYREAITELEGELTEHGAGVYGKRLREAIEKDPAVLKARDVVTRAKVRVVRSQARLAEVKHRFANFGEDHLRGEYEPSLVEWLVPPAVARQFKQEASAMSLPALMSTLSDWTNLQWARANMLATPGFHVGNLIDNWVIGRQLAGQMLLFEGKFMGFLENAASAQRVVLRTALRDFAHLTEKQRLSRIGRWRANLVEMVVGEHTPEVEKWVSEIKRMDIAGHGAARVYSGVNPTRDAVGLARVRPQRVLPGMQLYERVMNASRSVGAVLEDIPRVATYITARKAGYSTRDAKRLVDASFVNYISEIRRPLDDAMRQVFMFWPYMRGRTEQVLTSIYRKPWRAVVLNSATQRIVGGKPFGSPYPEDNSEWTEADRFLMQHGIRGKLSFLRGGYFPIYTERDDQDNVNVAHINGLPLPVNAIAGLHASPGMVRSERAAGTRVRDGVVEPGRGSHYLFVRSYMSSFEIMEMLQGIGDRGLGAMKDMLSPPIQALLGQDYGRENAPIDRKALLLAAVKHLGRAYVPQGRLIETAVTPARAVNPPRDPSNYSQAMNYQARQQYERERHALVRRQRAAAFFGLRMYTVSENELLKRLTPEERKRYWELRHREE